MTELKLGKLNLKNPVILASGTFDRSITKHIDVSKLGAITTKTITLKKREGNPLPHIIKTNYGWLNSNGWKNPGIDGFINDELPFWRNLKATIIQSIGGFCDNDYIQLAKIAETNGLEAIEVNVSCTNVEKGLSYLADINALSRLIRKVRSNFSRTLIVKLGANVTNIVAIAKNVLFSGADIISLTNTFPALEINNVTKKAKLPLKIGGYSGPPIKPLALRAVWEVYNVLKCPIIGGGGISDFDDALDFIMVGSIAVSIGSANFTNPKLSLEIVTELKKYMRKNKIRNLDQIRGII